MDLHLVDRHDCCIERHNWKKRILYGGHMHVVFFSMKKQYQ
jgi:hypothetical protein